MCRNYAHPLILEVSVLDIYNLVLERQIYELEYELEQRICRPVIAEHVCASRITPVVQYYILVLIHIKFPP